MRIDAYNQIAQLYGVSRTTKTAKTQSASRMSDQVSISQAGRDYQIAKKAVSEASDIREDKVALLKNMVDSGQYEVSGDDFASKLLERQSCRTTAYYYYIKHGIGSFHRPLNFFGNLLYTLSLKNTIIPPAFIKHLYKNKRYQFYLSYIHPGLIRSEH